MDRKTIAIVPARAGSKGIPRKNLVPLAGRPLIEYTIAAALQSGCCDQVLVSTEDAEIAAVAAAAGAEVRPRPAALALDSARSVEVVSALLGELEPDPEDLVVLLPVTSPLRSGDDIRGALETLLGTPGATSVVSVCEYEFPPAYALAWEGGLLRPLFPEHYVAGRSQRGEVPAHVRPNGAIYAARCRDFLAAGTFYTERTTGYPMPPERSIDIDRPVDLLLAEAIIATDGAR